MSTSNTSGQWLSIPVPEHLVPAVYQLIATRMAAPNLAEGYALTAIKKRVAESWTDDEIARAVNESPPAMKAIFERMALNPDTWLSSDDLAEALQTRLAHFGGKNKPQADWKTVAGTLGAFGNRVKGYGKSNWFTETRASPGGWKHRLSAEVAEKVLALLDDGRA